MPSFFLNLKTSRKMGLVFLLITAVALLISGFTWRNTSILEQASGWTTHTYQVLEQANKLTEAMVNAETGVRGYLVSTDERFLDPFNNASGNFRSAWETAKKLTSDNAEQQRRLDEIKKASETWFNQVAQKEISLVKSGQVTEARQLEASGAGKTSMDGLRAFVNEMVQAESSLLATRATMSANALSSTYMAITIGGICLVVLVIIGLLAVNMGLSRPMIDMTAAMGKLANNDLAVEIPNADRRDEIGDMAKAVQVFKDNAIRVRQLETEQRDAEARTAAQRKADLQNLAGEFEAAVGQIVDTVSSAATELEAAAGTLSQTASTTQDLSLKVASASSQASGSVQSVASATEEMASSIGEIGRQVETSTRIARDAVAQAEATDQRIAELMSSAGRIGDVVALINAIAGQTNLLALNATIEAARAGEAGRGFAVVASEVKELAAQTAKATHEISEHVAAIQSATEGSVTAIKGIASTIDNISQITSTIAAAVEEQNAATHEISRSVQQAAAGTSQVAENITHVNNGASETGSASSQVLSSAQTLSADSNRLKAEVRKFLDTIRAA
ncbi:methyl-accepting chemotaxis protein [Bradyrhizobium liaoningense]|uniref:methyl-accepting chemotaxis protein n=1 Tax=Bradyrhizobium liaoningense TaxID=43992 RepID=UPI001BAC9262|nr:CHASE3 domain-containing protein [Bradyrhizobium liaoningense]MBR0717744.1 CHASE3 domain-containing protein [Bradyrhizobium liaoningense]